MKVFGRATFQDYLPQPGELAVKIPGAVEVEVFLDRGAWLVRSVQTKGIFKGISGPPDYACREIATRFRRQLTPWNWTDEAGDATVSPTESALMHIIGANHMQAGLKSSVRKTACGKTVPSAKIAAEQYVSCEPCRKALEQIRMEAK